MTAESSSQAEGEQADKVYMGHEDPEQQFLAQPSGPRQHKRRALAACLVLVPLTLFAVGGVAVLDFKQRVKGLEVSATGVILEAPEHATQALLHVDITTGEQDLPHDMELIAGTCALHRSEASPMMVTVQLVEPWVYKPESNHRLVLEVVDGSWREAHRMMSDEHVQPVAHCEFQVSLNFYRTGARFRHTEVVSFQPASMFTGGGGPAEHDDQADGAVACTPEAEVEVPQLPSWRLDTPRVAMDPFSATDLAATARVSQDIMFVFPPGHPASHALQHMNVGIRTGVSYRGGDASTLITATIDSTLVPVVDNTTCATTVRLPMSFLTRLELAHALAAAGATMTDATMADDANVSSGSPMNHRYRLKAGAHPMREHGFHLQARDPNAAAARALGPAHSFGWRSDGSESLVSLLLSPGGLPRRLFDRDSVSLPQHLAVELRETIYFDENDLIAFNFSFEDGPDKGLALGMELVQQEMRLAVSGHWAIEQETLTLTWGESWLGNMGQESLSVRISFDWGGDWKMGFDIAAFIEERDFINASARVVAEGSREVRADARGVVDDTNLNLAMMYMVDEGDNLQLSTNASMGEVRANMSVAYGSEQQDLRFNLSASLDHEERLNFAGHVDLDGDGDGDANVMASHGQVLIAEFLSASWNHSAAQVGESETAHQVSLSMTETGEVERWSLMAQPGTAEYEDAPRSVNDGSETSAHVDLQVNFNVEHKSFSAGNATYHVDGSLSAGHARCQSDGGESCATCENDEDENAWHWCDVNWTVGCSSCWGWEGSPMCSNPGMNKWDLTWEEEQTYMWCSSNAEEKVCPCGFESASCCRDSLMHALGLDNKSWSFDFSVPDPFAALEHMLSDEVDKAADFGMDFVMVDDGEEGSGQNNEVQLHKNEQGGQDFRYWNAESQTEVNFTYGMQDGEMVLHFSYFSEGERQTTVSVSKTSVAGPTVLSAEFCVEEDCPVQAEWSLTDLGAMTQIKSNTTLDEIKLGMLGFIGNNQFNISRLSLHTFESFYHLAPQGSERCDYGRRVESYDACEKAAKQGWHTYPGYDRSRAPYGCSVRQERYGEETYFWEHGDWEERGNEGVPSDDSLSDYSLVCTGNQAETGSEDTGGQWAFQFGLMGEFSAAGNRANMSLRLVAPAEEDEAEEESGDGAQRRRLLEWDSEVNQVMRMEGHFTNGTTQGNMAMSMYTGDDDRLMTMSSTMEKCGTTMSGDIHMFMGDETEPVAVFHAVSDDRWVQKADAPAGMGELRSRLSYKPDDGDDGMQISVFTKMETVRDWGMSGMGFQVEFQPEKPTRSVSSVKLDLPVDDDGPMAPFPCSTAGIAQCETDMWQMHGFGEEAATSVLCSSLPGLVEPPSPTPSPTKSPSKKSKKSPKKKSPAKKSPAKEKSPTAKEKSPAKKSPAEKGAAKKGGKDDKKTKSPAKETPAKKKSKTTPAKETPAKKKSKTSPAKETSAKKKSKNTPAKETPAKETPAKKKSKNTPAKETPAKETPANKKSAKNPPAKTTPADKSGGKSKKKAGNKGKKAGGTEPISKNKGGGTAGGKKKKTKSAGAGSKSKGRRLFEGGLVYI